MRRKWARLTRDFALREKKLEPKKLEQKKKNWSLTCGTTTSWRFLWGCGKANEVKIQRSNASANAAELCQFSMTMALDLQL